MYQQREPDASSFRLQGFWEPEVVLEDGRSVRLEPKTEDRYAVIDEVIEDVVRLAVASWPEMDDAGRLRFGTEGSRDYAYDRGSLQAELDRRREAEHQLKRPLRVGDVFLIQGFSEADNPPTWHRLVDITKSGRRAARRAGLRAVAQPSEPEREDTRTRDLSWRRPPEQRATGAEQVPPPAGATVNPAV